MGLAAHIWHVSNAQCQNFGSSSGSVPATAVFGIGLVVLIRIGRDGGLPSCFYSERSGSFFYSEGPRPRGSPKYFNTSELHLCRDVPWVRESTLCQVRTSGPRTQDA